MQNFVDKINEDKHLLAIGMKGDKNQGKSKFRLTVPYVKLVKPHDREFPASGELSYANFI